MRSFSKSRLSCALCVAGALFFQSAHAQSQDIAGLSDEFNGRSLSADWKRFHAEYGWPDKLKALDMGRIDGTLSIQPYHSAWVRDLNAPFLFKTIEGDFDMRARLRVRGAASDIPGGTWSLGGLMARVPNGLNAAQWEPRAENWHFITTGVGHEPGRQMTETKGTYNSNSSLKLRPYRTGWIELRMVRIGMALFTLARPDGDGPWEVRDRFYRMQWGPNGAPPMQVGLIAYTTSASVPDGPEDALVINHAVNKDAPVDMVMDIDWIRFARPRIAEQRDWYAQVSGANPLADPNLPEAALLAALGG